jgi:pilus assembly protein Flp/PilA
MFRRFWNDETGATAIEYGLIAALICLAIVGGASTVGSEVSFMWGDNSSKLVQGLRGD